MIYVWSFEQLRQIYCFWVGVKTQVKNLQIQPENKFSISHIGDQDQDLEYKKRMIHTIGPSNIMLSLSTW
jgi:hypothetical protein